MVGDHGTRSAGPEDREPQPGGTSGPSGSSPRSSRARRRPARPPAADKIEGAIGGTTLEQKRVYAEYARGFFAAERLLYIHRPDIHTQHVWEVDAHGHVTASLQQSAAGEPGSGVVDTTAVVADGPSAEPPGASAEDPEQPEPGKPGEQRVPALVALDANGQQLVVGPEDGEDASSKPQLIVTPAIEVARLAEGDVAARIVNILYRIASDPPNWRRPEGSLDANQLMDELGYERSNDGRHQHLNRIRARDALLRWSAWRCARSSSTRAARRGARSTARR
jgi:hypothetical protein